MIKFGLWCGLIFCLAIDWLIYVFNVSEIGNNCKFLVFVLICFLMFNGIFVLNIMRKGLFCEG